MFPFKFDFKNDLKILPQFFHNFVPHCAPLTELVSWYSLTKFLQSRTRVLCAHHEKLPQNNCTLTRNQNTGCAKIVKTPTQPQHNLKATKPNSTKVGFETKITLHHHISCGSSPYKLRILHRNSKYWF